MQRSARDAAQLIRTALMRRGPPVAAFRDALSGVPVAEHDAWLDLLWDIDELPEDEPLPRGCVPYLPCPAATVLAAVREAAVTRDDVFVDVGAGLGRAAALTHMLTGAACIGLEIQPSLVRAAHGRAAWLNLTRVRFLEGDAVDLVRFVTIGTVFFLYCPFGGTRLQHVLDQLEAIARTRQIRVCCVSMPPLERPWLTASPSVSEDLTVYRSQLHRPPGDAPRTRPGPGDRTPGRT